MSASKRVCALPGCALVFEVSRGNSNRKYCGVAHRKLARRQRLESSSEAAEEVVEEALVPRYALVGGREPGPVPVADPVPLPPNTATPHRRLVPEDRAAHRRGLRLLRRLRRHNPPFTYIAGSAASRAIVPAPPRLRVASAPPVRVPVAPTRPVPAPAPAPAGRPAPGPSRRRAERAAPATSESTPYEYVAESRLAVFWSALFGETLRAALRSLSANRLRSLLTTLGIVIGVGAVILLVALGNGMKAHFNEQFSRLANQITVTPATGLGSGGTDRNLTDQDVAALSDPRHAPHIASVSPSMSGTVTLTVGQIREKANLVGATQNYLELLDRKIVAGTWLRAEGEADRDRQAVLGQQAINLLWGRGVDPRQVVGSKIRLDHTLFTVMGVLDSNGQSDNVVIVPFRASRAFLVGNHGGEVNQIVVKSTSVDTVAQAGQEVTDVLDVRHLVRKATERDFSVLTYTDLLNKSMQFINFLTIFIVAIAAISLLVGGIGVANIMLVSVTERTREIGIRKAVGATRRAILRQFLSEAVMLTGLGGVVGVGLGIGASLAGGATIPKAVPDFPTPILTLGPVLVAFGVSLAIGVLAGGYPAWRAARMKPIEALRFE